MTDSAMESPLTLAVIDDDVRFLRSLTYNLCHRGYKVMSYESIEKFEKSSEPYDVVITDGNIAGYGTWDGAELALRLEAAGKRVILLTGAPDRVPGRRPKIVVEKGDLKYLYDAIEKK